MTATSSTGSELYPLRLTAVAKPLVFGGHVIARTLGAPITGTAGEWSGDLDAAETLLLPACVGAVEIAGPADVLVGYLPDLDRDVRRPLAAAGYGLQVVAQLGEGLG